MLLSTPVYQTQSQYGFNGLVFHLAVGVIYCIVTLTYLHLINLCEGVG